MNWFNNPWDGSDGLLEFERPAPIRRIQPQSSPSLSPAQRDINVSVPEPANQPPSRPVEGQGQRNDNGGAFAMIGAMLATAASLERNRRRRTDYRSGTLGLEPQSPIPLPPIQQPGGSPQPLAARYLRHKWEREWEMRWIGENAGDGNRQPFLSSVGEEPFDNGTLINPYTSVKNIYRNDYFALKASQDVVFKQQLKSVLNEDLQFFDITNINSKIADNEDLRNIYNQKLNEWTEELEKKQKQYGNSDTLKKNMDRLTYQKKIVPDEQKVIYEYVRASEAEARVSKLLKDFKLADPELYTYINNLKVKYQQFGVGEEKELLLKIRIYVGEPFDGRAGLGAAATRYETLPENHIRPWGTYKSQLPGGGEKKIRIPYAIPKSKPHFYKIQVWQTPMAVYPSFEINILNEGDSLASLANEFGDVMYAMEYNQKAVEGLRPLENNQDYMSRPSTIYSFGVEQNFRNKQSASGARYKYPLLEKDAIYLFNTYFKK